MSHLQSPHSSSEGGAPDDEKVRHLEVLLQDSKKDALRSKTAAEEAMQRLQGLRAMDVDRVDALVEQVALPSGVCFCGVCFCGVRARLASLCESSVKDRQTETETETETDRLCVCVCVSVLATAYTVASAPASVLCSSRVWSNVWLKPAVSQA